MPESLQSECVLFCPFQSLDCPALPFTCFFAHGSAERKVLPGLRGAHKERKGGAMVSDPRGWRVPLDPEASASWS
jgi:hypothetical protein